MNYETDFFKIKHNNIEPSVGKILISEPFLQDHYFKRSVVLLTEHNNEGSLGLILNKPLDIALHDVLYDFPRFDATVCLGGPVSTERIFYMHTLGGRVPGSIHIINNLYWGGDFDILKILINSGDVATDEICFFIGYSGWSASQLESELSRDSWLVSEADMKTIMHWGNADMWQLSLKYMETRYRIWRNFPENPALN